ncbi:hypothetical protein BGX26_001482 [Mortierella sp. AD094]|nr:hypothetical protein BGX26_001482 [Mortierella sp. AD094]
MSNNNNKKQTQSAGTSSMGPSADLFQPSAKGHDLPSSQNKDHGIQSLSLQGNTKQQGIDGSGYDSPKKNALDTESEFLGLSRVLFKRQASSNGKDASLVRSPACPPSAAKMNREMPKESNRKPSESAKPAAPGALENSSRTTSQASISNGPSAPVELTLGKLFTEPKEISASPTKGQSPYISNKRINSTSSTSSMSRNDGLNSPRTSVIGLGLAAAAAHGTMNPDHFAPSARQYDAFRSQRPPAHKTEEPAQTSYDEFVEEEEDQELDLEDEKYTSTKEVETAQDKFHGADGNEALEGHKTEVYAETNESYVGPNEKEKLKEEFDEEYKGAFDEEYEGEYEDEYKGEYEGEYEGEEYEQEFGNEPIQVSYYGPGFNHIVRDTDEFSLYRDDPLALDLTYSEAEANREYYDREFTQDPNDYEETYEQEEEHHQVEPQVESQMRSSGSSQMPQRRSMPPPSSNAPMDDTPEKKIT